MATTRPWWSSVLIYGFLTLTSFVILYPLAFMLLATFTTVEQYLRTVVLPIPNIENSKFPEARRWEERGEHTKLYRFSPGDFKNLSAIWSGSADWADGAPLQVVDGTPPGGPMPEGSTHHAGFAPEYEPGEIFEIAQRLMKSM